MQNSDDQRREIAKLYPTVIACDKREAFAKGANATKQSIYPRVFSAQKLAAAAGLSERYVNELLYEAGASCTTRLLELRLRKAADLLAHSGERRISDIAFGCGFNDLSYFNRCFRRRFGQTPTAARGVACSAGRRFVIRIRTKPAKRYFDATCASHPRYHVMTMSNDDIYTPPRPRTERSFRERATGRERAAGRGPVIDQEGREIPDPSMRAQFEGLRFEFGNSGANPFANLTREQRLARLDAIAKLLDVAFIVPGTKFRYGIDGLIGLIPVVGDIITTAISLWLVREARALGAPWHITARMLGNVAVDGVVGLVPVAGDAFDVMFRANVRNVRMLKRWLDQHPR